MKSLKRICKPHGFTLIELLTVILIILVVAAMIIGAAGYAQKKAAINRAKAEIAQLENAIESYKSDNGIYPATGIANVYTALTGGSKKYMTFRADQLSGTTLIDPFGVAYAYTYPGANNKTYFDLSSNGPDRSAGNTDDISNWKQ